MRTCKKLLLLLLAIVLTPVSPGETAEPRKQHIQKAKILNASKQAVRENKKNINTTEKGRDSKEKKTKTANKTNVSPDTRSVRISSKSQPLTNNRISRGARNRLRQVAEKRRTTTIASTHPSVRLYSDDIQKRISSKSVVILDARTGETLYEQNGDLPRQPASTIKILTGLLAIEHLNARDLVPTSQHAAEMPSSKVNLQIGRAYPANDIINAILLESANDASVAVAEKIAGTEDEFAQLMTARARRLGATNTQCRSASGLTTEGQYSTARDLALMFQKAMQNEEFATRMARQQTETWEGKVLRNHNKALWRVEGAEGGKTGFTNAARQTYVGKFRRGGDELIVAIMGSESMWRDVEELVEFGFKKKQQVAVAATGSKKPDVEDQLSMLRMNLMREEVQGKKRQDF